VEIRVRLFGAFRRWSPDGELRLSAPPGTSAAALRALLLSALERQHTGFDGRALVSGSALADETRLLDEGWTVPVGGPVELAILPPVCGG
jgi:molybdopterin converting factor small subunit